MLLNFRLYFYEHIFLPLWFAFKRAKKKKKKQKKTDRDRKNGSKKWAFKRKQITAWLILASE